MGSQLTSLELNYGNNGRCELNFAGRLEDRRHCGLAAVASLQSAVFASLGAPLEFPPIEQAIVVGDRVVLAVDPSIPQLGEVVAQVVLYLVGHGVDFSQIRIVLAGQDSADVRSIERALCSVTDDPIEIETHDPDDSTKIAYVAASEAADPIYMSRSLVDAEVVIPITCARCSDALDYFGMYTLFPRLSDRRTRGRFLDYSRLADAHAQAELRNWADQAAWWVGLCVAIEVVPGANGTVAGVRAGTPYALEQAVQQDMRAAWHTVIDQPAELVLALIDGVPAQQTWDNVGRALHVARRAAARGGAIVVCCQLNTQPGRALMRLRDPNRNADVLAKQLSNDSTDDALAAAVILAAVQDHHVYLLSCLDNETIEDLGMGAISSSDQLEHLVAQHSSCLILGTAQHRMVE